LFEEGIDITKFISISNAFLYMSFTAILEYLSQHPACIFKDEYEQSQISKLIVMHLLTVAHHVFK